MTHDTRKACRQMARDLDINGLARQCLRTRYGAVSAHQDAARGLLIYRDGGTLTVSHRGQAVFRQDGSNVVTFHNGAWVDDLRALAHERHIAAHFSC